MSIGWRAVPPLLHRAAVVTGGTRGIGAAICTELAAQGCTVFAVARRAAEPEQLERWAAAAGPPGQQHGHAHTGSVTVLEADVSTPDGRESLPPRVEQLLRSSSAASHQPSAEPQQQQVVSILINNAGTNIRKPTVDYTASEFDTILRTNFISAFHLSQLFHPQLAASGSGAVVNIGSVSGGASRTNTGSVYGALKSGLNGLTRSLAAEWAPQNIRVNCGECWLPPPPCDHEGRGGGRVARARCDSVQLQYREFAPTGDPHLGGVHATTPPLPIAVLLLICAPRPRRGKLVRP
jgi:Tropinone reductase 1